MTLRCGITIPTHNRKDDLQRTCSVLMRLEPRPDEIWICIDGCSDDTHSWLRTTYPNFRVIYHGHARGSVASRDEMMRSSNADVLLSLDDDSYPVELDSIKRIEQLFAHNPRLAIAAFPQRSDEYPDTLSVSDFGPAHFIGTFSNAGTAIRRSTFLEVGGYPLQFGHAYEEPDFALRCLAAGFEVKFEPTLTIRHHYTTAQRNEMRTHHSHARNELWSVILRCPLPQLLLVAFFRIARQLGYARKRGWSWVLREPIWWLRCLRGIPHALAKRSPIAWSRYRGWMELVRRPIFDRSEWKRKFAAGRK